MTGYETAACVVASALGFVLGVLVGVSLVYWVRRLEVRGRFDADVARIIERQREVSRGH